MILDRDLSFRFPLLSGDDVRAVQQTLIRAGAMRAEADGVFGPLTRDAVAALQRRAGLAADGVLRRGPGTGCCRPRLQRRARRRIGGTCCAPSCPAFRPCTAHRSGAVRAVGAFPRPESC
jgi:peptidoglycan hydrolase-like protein with peptidoglycan-binding domain